MPGLVLYKPAECRGHSFRSHKRAQYLYTNFLLVLVVKVLVG